jgi:hypothetical protein
MTVIAPRLNPLDETASIAWDNVPLACWETYRYGASLGAARRLLAARPDYW